LEEDQNANKTTKKHPLKSIATYYTFPWAIHTSLHTPLLQPSATSMNAFCNSKIPHNACDNKNTMLTRTSLHHCKTCKPKVVVGSQQRFTLHNHNKLCSKSCCKIKIKVIAKSHNKNMENG
jgi:hypothetical protein